MDHLFGDSIPASSLFFLIVALLLAFSFEFVNGFHDTANAVATVIYTHSLKPVQAVVWSGCWNLIGVLLSAGTVAFGIIALLPVELVINVGSGAGFAMVFSLLISAIIWNVGTWYFGLPASSSHTLLGSIIGVGLANSVVTAGHQFGDGVNWGKLQDTLTALVVSPIIGFAVTALLLLAMKAVVKYPSLYKAPDGETPPPWPIRALLVLTCTGVSYAHGSNDGQKGQGLILLILIGIVPAGYAINLGLGQPQVAAISTAATGAQAVLTKNTNGAPAPEASAAATQLNAFVKSSGKVEPGTVAAVAVENQTLMTALHGKSTLADIPKDQRGAFRGDVFLVQTSINKLIKNKVFTADPDKAALTDYAKKLDGVTKFIPLWIKVCVALALGLGTMIGWKRIVVTVGEKIGKDHLTYAQGASAEIVTFATIEAADLGGLPVSTTHILSSGIAGAMFANRSGLQMETLRNILMAWVLTLPVCVFLGSMLFAAGLRIITAFGVH